MLEDMYNSGRNQRNVPSYECGKGENMFRTVFGVSTGAAIECCAYEMFQSSANLFEMNAFMESGGMGLVGVVYGFVGLLCIGTGMASLCEVIKPSRKTNFYDI